MHGTFRLTANEPSIRAEIQGPAACGQAYTPFAKAFQPSRLHRTMAANSKEKGRETGFPPLPAFLCGGSACGDNRAPGHDLDEIGAIGGVA
ncbi:MAG: hypothetical protein LJE67_05365, partial [Salaquimonas sp.]|nr:hypothetical protein [Salaquimonas sp.]